MTEMYWAEPWLHKVLEFMPLKTKSVLDIGAGRGIIGALVKIYREPYNTVALEVFEPYAEFLEKNLRVYDRVVRWDLRKLPLPFGDREFDVLVCLEVIEHIPRRQGEILLDEFMRIADRIIISTPNRFFEQPLLDKNPFQKHLSTWAIKDFKSRGFFVRGVGKFLFFGHIINYLNLSNLLGSVTYPFPQFSSQIFAVWDRSGHI